MNGQFRDRVEAGQLLAQELAKYENRNDVLVLALPRGGVPVAFEVARKLNAPLDVFIVRKLGVPGHRELAMGAIATGGIRIINQSIVQHLHIPRETIEAIAAQEEKELLRREQAYRHHEPLPQIEGKLVILVDDGIATGATMCAAAQAIRRHHPKRLVIAAPTASPSVFGEFETVADELVVLVTPEDFFGVGQSYLDFAQTTDTEVTRLLELARRRADVAQ